MAAIDMPSLPVAQHQFIQHVAAHPETPIPELLLPFQQYENELRKVFAQQPDHAVAKQCSIVPVFEGHEQDVTIRARNLDAESNQDKESYIMPLEPAERKPNDTMAIAKSLQDFKTNFNIFTESSLVDMNWDNVVVAGSAVVTSLLSVPKEHAHSKRSLRRYYHEIVAPASDVDLFLYDLTEEQAVEKIKEIEKNVRDALLVETTSIRTKNTITIASQYPVRHVQIVLRIYKSITEILTGFDVDCSCGAYDGKQVWASPRALAAYMTQTNTLDLSRRSPSYENRLSKYRHRGFEVRFLELDRTRIDPTIYERSFSRTEGLARLLILEKLPKTSEREAYIDQRRLERGRPAADRSRMKQKLTRGNIKNKWEDEVAEWVDADEVSNYHTFTVPYGPKFHARKIEKLLYTKDLLLNAEWNAKGREVNLHRHPAFFGSVEDVIGDCCGDCPAPVTIEEEEAAEQESKIYVSGKVSFMKDDCGRQAIGSFNPLSPEQYTDMAYVGNTQLLCQAIIDQDVHYVEQWLSQEGNDPSTRDHTGRCPLHLAVTSSTLEIVQCLIDHGARLVARLVDGKTALHLACLRGDPRMVAALLKKSEANEEEEANKTDAKRKLRLAAREKQNTEDSSIPSAQDATFEIIDEADADTDVDAMTEGSVVNIKKPGTDEDEKLDVQDDDSPDVYDVNVLTWDTPTSPLHLAVLNGHLDVVKCLVEDFGANVLLPVVLPSAYAGGTSAGVLLSLTLATRLPLDKAKEMTRLLFKLGASCAQADSTRKTALECCIASAPELLQTYLDADPTGAARALRHVSVQGSTYNVQPSGPMLAAISSQDDETALRLLSAGARADIPFEAYMKGVDKYANQSSFEDNVQQPVILAVEGEMPSLAAALVEQYGIDCNTMTNDSWRILHNAWGRSGNGQTLLDLVKNKVKQLREWKYEKPMRVAPHPLKDDSEYLSEYPIGSYQFWSATQQLESAKLSYKYEWEAHVREAQRIVNDEENGLEEKTAAIYDKLDQFRKLETLLEKRSAKTFKELHPDVEEREDVQQRGYNRYRPSPKEPFAVKFDFKTSLITSDEIRERYVRMFNSVWQGEIKIIKELTMLPWTNAKGEQCPPLRIHVFDNNHASPLSIAMLNGRVDVAKLIMRIAEAQYAPPEPQSARQYRIEDDSASDNDDNDNGNDSEDAEIRITSEVIDDQPTIEDIGMVSLFVKTGVKPETMIYWSNLGVHPYHASAPPMYDPGNLIEDALRRDENPRILPFLLDLSEETTTKIEGSLAADRFVAKGHIKMKRALMFAKPYMLAELIKRTAVGVSIDKLALDHKAKDTMEKSKYYQGLNVHGRKRRDWADAGRNSAGMDAPGPQTPPLLLAAYYGTLDHVEWFMSDAPLRCYTQFADRYQDDKRLQRLSQVPGGFEGMVKKFLNTRSQLAIHASIARHQTADSLEILKYLIKAMPDALEARSADGMTPLLLAYRAHNLEAVKILLEAGANQTARDKEGMNLLHHITATTSNFVSDLAHIRNLIETIDKRLIPGMCVQRCSRNPGSLTPLALLVTSHYDSNEIRVDMARLILEYSQGAELELLNGEGHTPLHVVARTDPTEIRHHHFKLAAVLVENNPALVAWENATGTSPLEMVQDKILARKCSNAESSGRPNKRARSFLYGRHAESLTEIAPQAFLKPTIDAKKELEDLEINLDCDQSVSSVQRVERLERLLRDVQVKLDAEGKGKRRLVTLNEASEVARRLAAVQRQRVERTERMVNAGEGEGGDGDEDEDVFAEQGSAADEVEQWLRDPCKCSGLIQ